MSARTVWVALCAYSAIALPVGFVLAGVAIWFDSGRFGGLAGLFGVPAVILGGFLLMIYADGGAPKARRGFTRADRKRLRDEQRRIAVDAEIARMEREAGL